MSMSRPLFRRVIKGLFWPAIIILALNVENLASALGWDKLLTPESPVMVSVLEVAQSGWFQFPAMFVLGAAIALWIDSLLRQPSNSELKPLGELNELGPITEDIFNQEYKMRTVELDGRRFVSCIFEDVTFNFEGKAHFEFVSCKHQGHSGYLSNSGALNIQLHLLKMMGALDKTFGDNIRIIPKMATAGLYSVANERPPAVPMHDPYIDQLRTDVRRLVRTLGDFGHPPDQARDVFSRLKRIEESEHPLWLDRDLEQARVDFLHWCWIAKVEREKHGSAFGDLDIRNDILEHIRDAAERIESGATR
jgi:hypothetical protein